MYVSEPISDDEDLSTSGDGDRNLMCCVYGNCSCNSLDHALANLASNVLINITTDVMFTTLINASNLENVSIIGHSNPIAKKLEEYFSTFVTIASFKILLGTDVVEKLNQE